MGDNLTMFKKGVVLITIPVLFQLIFAGLLFRTQRAEAEASRLTNHTKDVIAYAEATTRHLMDAHAEVRSLIISSDPKFFQSYREAITRVQTRLDELKDLVSDNPPQQAKVLEIAALVANFRAWLDESAALVRAGESEKAFDQIKNLSGKYILDDIRNRFDTFLNEEERLAVARQKTLEQSRAHQYQLLIGSVVASLALALGMTYLFSRGISGRLAVLSENVRRLGAKQELVEPIEGRDEIGGLDRVFHDMARTLKVRDQENEMFIYSVSHDLRSPLVNLQGFSKELEVVCKEVRDILDKGELTNASRTNAVNLLDRDIPESIHFIQAAVTRLAAIIDVLLRLSRAGRVEYRSQWVNVAESVARVVESLGGTLEQREARVITKELPPAWGDPTAIEQVFANLVGNAVNYLDPDRPGRIEIGRVPGGEPNASAFHTYYVKDNGQGIPEAYQPKLFLAFQRFHKDSAPGEGIGLTLIRRAVERHGGTIRVESKAGEGSTFFVTLPARAPETDGMTKRIQHMERELYGS